MTVASMPMYVAAANHDGDLHAVTDDFNDLFGKVVDDFGVDSVPQIACKRLA